MSDSLFRNYIASVKNVIEPTKNDIVSIVLFGSMANKQAVRSPSTDVDLLVVVSDLCSSSKFMKIKRSLLRVENEFFSRFRKDEASFFSTGLQGATGMFVNIFVCRFSDFKDRRFSKVFNTNPIMSSLLAPKNSVWISILKKHTIIFGKNIFQEWETSPKIHGSDLIKSFIMNWLLSLGALIFFPIHKQIKKFSMEAMKWSLFTWSNFNNLPETQLKQIVAQFINNASIIECRALREFLMFREKREVTNYFPFLAWIFVFKIHYSLFKKY